MQSEAPQPPPRAPFYGDTESYGWPPRQCALNLLNTLARWCSAPREFKGSAQGRVWHFSGDFEDHAQLLFTSDSGDGRIDLSINDNDWVCAELFVADAFVLRAWIEDPWEEKEFWPDGSSGKPDAQGDAAGRISKRGAWLQIRCADFPGVPADADGYFSLDDARN